MNYLTVSIITVCFNSEEFIESAIESVLSQTYLNIEYIIIDGGSTDSTVSIVESFGGKITHLVSGPDMGIYDAMNKGLALASGDVIGILNSDDFYLDSDVISNVASIFNSHTYIDIVLGDVDYVNPNDLSKPIRCFSSQKFRPWKMRFGFMPPHPATFIRRSVYNKVGIFKISFHIAADFEWFVRAFLVHHSPFISINKTLVRMRLGGISTSGLRSNFISTKEIHYSLRSNHIWSSFFFVSFRLPIKFLNMFFFRFFHS